MALLLQDNSKTRFYFKDGMMRERTIDDGDNLWRTSLAYIAYGHPALKEGMLRCLYWYNPDHVQFYRSVEHTDRDVSRDQITMFLAALAVKGESLDKYVKAIKWKISSKYSLTMDMWLWMKALTGGNAAKKRFFRLEIPVVSAYLLWNASNISKQKFPSYAVHLLAWQIFSLNDNSDWKKKLSSLVLKLADEDNYLVRLLLGFEVDKQQVDFVKPMTDFIWQRYRNDSNLRLLTPEEAEFNTLDKDVLTEVYNINQAR
jgi:hypothetical protein